MAWLFYSTKDGLTLLTEILKTERTKWNKKIMDDMKLKYPSTNFKGALIDVKQAVLKILQLYQALGSTKKKKIYFKLCVDGREINGNKLL